MTLQDHVASNGSKFDTQKAAAKALLQAITAQTEETVKDGGGIDVVNKRLANLASTYALVVHGNSKA